MRHQNTALLIMAFSLVLGCGDKSALKIMESNAANSMISRPCADFATSTQVKEILDYLPKTSAVSPKTWPEYDPGSKDYVLQSVKIEPGCIIPVRGGQILEPIKLSAPAAFPNQNPSFGLYQVDSIACANWADCSLSPEFDKAMRQIGINTAMVYNGDFRHLSVHHWKDYEIAAHGFSNYDAEALVHEAFHDLGEIISYVDNRNPTLKWPAWARPQGRDDIEKRCYKSRPEVTTAFSAEVHALISAVQLAATGNDVLAKSATSDFLTLRMARRSLLSTTVAANEKESDLSYCVRSEPAMEMFEGVANWVGDSADIANGVMGPDKMTSFLYFAYDNASSEFFYWFGEYQLYLMWKLFPTSYPNATQALITAPDSNQGIEAQLRGMLSR